MTERRTDAGLRDRIDELIAVYERLVATYERFIRWARPSLAIVLIGFALGGYSILQLIQRNTKAIEVSCILNANIVTEAGAAGGLQGASEAARLQRKITALAFDVLITQMTPKQLAEFTDLNVRLKAAGAFVTLPNCRQVSRHPESVRQLGDQPTQRQHQRTVTTPTVTVPQP